MDSDNSDAGPHHKRKRKNRCLEDSSESTSSSSSPIIGSSSRTRRRPFRERKPIEDSSDSDSDSGSLIHIYNKRKKVGRVMSDTDSDDSGSTIIKRSRVTGRIESESDDNSDVSDRGFEGSSSSQWETDFSGTEADISPKVKKEPSKEIQDNIDSDSSDGQSEKCPICLISFKSQEIGVPESCDHMFCLECIQEWSKNMNTCPIDRQEYNLILVRKDINGKVTRQVSIERPTPQNDVDIVEDPTFCEVCGTSENEDQMLLCDGCDLGFHLYCLTPPLEEVPADAWFCNDCSPDDVYNSEIELYEIALLLDDAETVERPQGRRRNQSARLIPRTRQSERVRRRIANNRQQIYLSNSHLEHPSTSSRLEESLLVDAVSSSTSRVRRTYRPKKAKRTSKRREVRYKTVYEIDEATGETVPVRKRQTKSKKSKRRLARGKRYVAKPKTVKKRLATQLGICVPRTVPQNVPHVKIKNSNTLGGMRHQAGIPTLHLFGQSNDLDYFSDGDEDNNYMSGPQMLIRRAPNQSDMSALRRIARRKAVLTTTVSSSTDLLDSILSSQEQFHSRNSSYSVDSCGKFKIERGKSQNNKYIDVNKQNVSIRQRPNSYQNQNTGNSSGFNRNTNNYHSHGLNQYHSTPTSTMESTSPSSFSGEGREQNEVPQDYTQRTLCASNEANTQGKREKDEDNTGTNTPNSESEIDIYSDIETVSTSKVDDGDLRAPSPPIISNTPNTGTDDDNNDSEPDMVIDDEKVQEPEKNQEDYKEETTVTSTVGFISEFLSTTVHPVSEIPHSSMEIQSGAIQSSNLTSNKNNEEDDDSADGCPNTSIYSRESINVLKDAEDIDSDDGCPNFSIYSKESKSVALHTDISLSAEDNTQTQQDYQVGEISSSPNVAVHESFMPHSPLNHLNEIVSYASDRNIDEEQIEQYQLETSAFSMATIQESQRDHSNGDETSPPVYNPSTQSDAAKKLVIGGILGGLYSDSEDESVVKKDSSGFVISDINHMTEDISEEERSYTPCLDERATRQGLEGLDTELISDEDRNDFDESHELKTVSDGDALEINAKESELDFTRPEDYEEGEIVDKNKEPQNQEEPEKEKKKSKPKKDAEDGKEEKKSSKKKDKDKPASENDKSGNKENEVHNKEASFKKLSKNNKERNYRDKDKETARQRTPNKPPEDREQNRKERKREKRKELERYNVRAIIAEKPRPQIVKDQFGRDVRRTPTRSRSRSYTPPIQTSPTRARESPTKSRRSASRQKSLSRGRKSASKEKVVRKRRPRSRNRSLTRSRSRSPTKMRSKNKKRKRSSSRYDKRRKSRDRSKIKKKPRSRSRHRSRSVTSPRRKRGWNRREREREREWTPRSLSRSPKPHRNMSPSWTPPRLIDNSQNLRNENLTVLLNNSNKKKKERRRKINDKRPTKESTDVRQKKRRRDRERTPPPSKEVFASGDNILVSVSFNNENETRDVTTRDRRKKDMEDIRKKKRKNRNRRDLSGVKPVAIIDLERSPFKEITPSPKHIIVLSDSDNNDNENANRNVQQNICDSSQLVASPERSINYSMGPKTPPEPQVKFSLSAKPPQVRAINNPLHEPDDLENNDDVQEEVSSRINEVLHKGPNTPPEPPNSSPGSPDVYDPFEPTKSRSPTPDPDEKAQSNTSINLDDNNGNMESRSATDLLEKSTNQTPDVIKSLTPPIADVQPADSQSSIHATPDSNIGKSPERIGVVINQTVQPSLSTSKPVAQTTPFSSVPTSMITSTPVSSNLAPSRINILNSTIITPPLVASSIPQRIVLPNQVKSSPVKISPTKAAIKSTPIKPMPNKSNKSNARKNRSQNANGIDDINLDFDSPYSPGSSDYEDLFEPPSESIVIHKSSKTTSKNNAKSSQKHQSTFDALFGSPNFHKSKNKNDKFKFGKKSLTPTKTKTVGVKLDEDNLKILDELPNSAVEMQVKDKFLKKLNRQERVVEEVKLVLKPHYNKKRISKEEYKDILRRSVPKICHNKSGEINPTKIKNLIEAYVKKIRHSKKVTSSSSVNPQKVTYQEKKQPRLKTRWNV